MTVSEMEEEKIRCFFDISLSGISLGRIIFELYPNIASKTVENFRSLCTGECGNGKTTGKPLHFKGCIFHRVIKDFMIQSGDFSNGNGTGGESIYGGTFDDEAFILKHDKPFLLSMANRGKNTNGSQFFITTQPAPHLDNVHVVFGSVVSGHDLVRQLESLPIDRNSRPLEDVMINNSGELIRHMKVKKEKKKKKSTTASENSDSEIEEKRKKRDKKRKKDKKSSKTEVKVECNKDEEEEGEIEEGEIHPMVSITKIDPDEIPEVSNKFLMRNTRQNEEGDNGERTMERQKERVRDNKPKNFGWSKNKLPLSRSGRVVKGRGVFRYRTPSRSRSRSRSYTPPHWKQAQKRTIKLSDFERIEEEKRVRDVEIKRRESERRKRHDEIARDAKKSFFELHQKEKHNENESRDNLSDKEEGELEENVPGGKRTTLEQQSIRNKSPEPIDMNALDYEHHGSDTEERNRSEKHNMVSSIRKESRSRYSASKTNKSEHMAMAFGVEIKQNNLPVDRPTEERRKRGDEGKFKQQRELEVQRSRYDKSFAQRGAGRRSRSRDRNVERRDNRERYRRRRSYSRDRYSKIDRRRKSRSLERAREKSREISQDRDRSNRGSTRRDSRKPRSREKSRSKSVTKEYQEKDRKRRTVSKSPQRRIKVEEPSEEEKARIQKEKMLKRAEALLLLKSHMEKEIELQKTKREYEKRMKEQQDEYERKEKEEQSKAKRILELIRLRQPTADEPPQTRDEFLGLNIIHKSSRKSEEKSKKSSKRAKSSSSSSSSSSEDDSSDSDRQSRHKKKKRR